MADKIIYTRNIVADLIQDFEIELDLADRINNDILGAIILAEGGEFIETAESIEAIVCDYFKLPLEKLTVKSRKREFVRCRQISAYYYKKENRISGEKIGKKLGDKSQATILYYVKTVNNLIATDPEYKKDIGNLTKKINIFIERKKLEKNGKDKNTKEISAKFG